jgi:CRP/FNR family cyclic AMP-dependent transcriptional regulator
MPIAPLILKQFDLFKQLPDDMLELVSNQAQLVEVPKRKVVMEKNMHTHSLGLLLEGRLQGIDVTIDGREAGLYFVDTFDFFGELSVIDQLPASEFIIALTASKFIMIPAATIQHLINESAIVSNIINRRLAQRLRESMSQRTLLSMPSPMQRVCAQLMQLTIKSNNATIAFAPTHQEIAIMINTTRETVTRAFQKLQADGVLIRDGNHLIIHNLEYLKKTANGESSGSS